jgi:uncharacterized protein (TIGR00303 family)
MKLVLVLGSTDTATIPGITAAGETPKAVYHTPAADAEIVHFGAPRCSPVVPISPSGCPTPAVVTRAVRDLVEFPVRYVDAGITKPCGAPLIDRAIPPGKDIRSPVALPEADKIIDTATTLGTELADDHLLLGESIPGGTTTALGTLRALGESFGVSSSLETNPLSLKETTVATGLTASDISPGDAAQTPSLALKTMGDPVLATLFGLAKGALTTDTELTLCGGTQMIAVGALLRHAAVSDSLTIATTIFLATDPSSDIEQAANDLGISLEISDPAFTQTADPVFSQYASGMAKEGVAMGGALWIANTQSIQTATLHDQIMKRYTSLQQTHES